MVQHYFKPLERQELHANPPDDDSAYPQLHALIGPHLDSFDNVTEFANSTSLLELSVADIGRKVLFDGNSAVNGGLGNKLAIWLEDPHIGRPMVPDKAKSRVRLTYPSECRERLTSYRGKLQLNVCMSINDGPVQRIVKDMGQIPIMVRSNKCNLYGMTPKQLLQHSEESEEMGGYFIVNGIERIIRMLIVNRRNYPLALIRGSFQNRGQSYSQYGVQIRCVRPDQTSQSNTLHYLTDGSCMFRFAYRKQEFLIPAMLILRALVNVSDKQIFDAIVQGNSSNTFLTSRVELLLRNFKAHALYTQNDCLAYLGQHFHVLLGLPEDATDLDNGRELLRRLVLVHLENNGDKFRLLAFMIQKLYALVAGDCCQDNPDSPQNQEILLGGHLYCAYLKEKLEEWLLALTGTARIDLRRGHKVDFHNPQYIQKLLQKTPADMGRKLEYFLATGNIVTSSGMDLQQMSGYTIVAEKLNFYRYLSHFRCVHRGAFFQELKTTTVRKLLPEAWGFLCPVHTPDGAPCGLLNHLSHSCVITTKPANNTNVVPLLVTMGMTPAALEGAQVGADQVCVQLDGRVVGWCSPDLALQISQQLRYLKVSNEGSYNLSRDMEIGLVPTSHGGQFPGLFLFTEPARMIRPVKYLATNTTDMVGSFEQVYMNIACMTDEVVPGQSTHIELAPTSMLSVVANLTPFSDHNQSPRNVYQCQMGKQTMGTPCQAIARRTDNKMYRIQTPQTPIVRPSLHEYYGVDEFPGGTNAVIAVISYTGYDMEDAMIINKSSHERGFGYGTVYKSEIIDLDDYKSRNDPQSHYFGLPVKLRDGEDEQANVDRDGLPFVGARLVNGSAFACIVNSVNQQHRWVKYKGTEVAYIDEVRLIGSDTGEAPLTKIHIKLRIPRPPVIGDKFSSRHGQKGVCSQKWPTVNMPFSERGIVPDVIINPHAFPSRMTIGMFVEQLAAKSGALHGISQDATPFKFNEDHPSSAFFGEQLKKAGYNYYGNEPMYSGITGQEFKADIYLGIVYYQRLRHMVSDKYQVRTVGPVHNLTQQPVKGRKRAGGIRFGEMERDSLLAHGVSYLLQDRLMNCSDYSQTHMCRQCGSFLAIVSLPSADHFARRDVSCRLCGHGKKIDVVAVPYVFRYLCTELMAMGIRLKMDIK
ncbi:hypothetical protein RI367_000995 [Sorochytrium milnesiophthora]